MGWSKPELACTKHQNHKQLQGVCPFCLRERLSQLYDASPSVVVAPCSSSQSSSPAYSSASSLKSMSPIRSRHQRNVSEIIESISYMLSVGHGLKKSRSIAFVPRNFVGEVKNGKKKKGFWSKLLQRERNKEILMHSRTVKERLD